MAIRIAGLAPHPPLLIPEVGGRDIQRVEATEEGMRELARALMKEEIEIILTISPHGPVFSDCVSILDVDPQKGSLAAFGVSQVEITAPFAREALGCVEKGAQAADVPLKILNREEARRYRVDPLLDHGVLVPLYFFQEQGLEASLLPVNMGLLSYEALFALGRAMGRELDALPQKVAVIASGDLSHRLTPQAPAGFSPRGQEFDDRVVDIIEKGDLKELLHLEQGMVEKAGECGLRPLIILAGVLEDLNFTHEVLSYEGPFGVGYAVGLFQRTEEEELGLDPVELAREAICAYVKEGRRIEGPDPLPPYFQKPAGTFVSLKDPKGTLLGCIGTLRPTRENVACEIIRNAIEAATGDPRFAPLKPSQLEDLQISVDILEPPEEVRSLNQLNHKKYGIIVEKGSRKAVLLPDLPGIHSTEEQISIARMKAEISPHEEICIQRFRVQRFIQE